jgi:hypothetical protein
MISPPPTLPGDPFVPWVDKDDTIYAAELCACNIHETLRDLPHNSNDIAKLKLSDIAAEQIRRYRKTNRYDQFIQYVRERGG